MKHHPLLLTIWKDKKIVPIVSNIHLSKFVKIEKKYENSKITKTMPKSIDDYNTYARGIDRCNQISHHYRFPHKSRKWWRQIFMHILHMIVANSRVIYTKITGKSLGHKEFIIDIIQNLLDGSNVQLPKNKKINYLPKLIQGCDKKSQWYCEDCSSDKWVCSLCLGERDCYDKYHNN